MHRLTVLAVVLAALAFSQRAEAQMVGISKEQFAPHYRAQRTMAWCWASSAEMALSYQGIRIPQEAIVTRIKGFTMAARGSAYDIIRATNGIVYDQSRRAVVVSGQFVLGAPLPTVLYTHLRRGRPVILTYTVGGGGLWGGHSVVLLGIDYLRNGDALTVTRIYVADPYPYSQAVDANGRTTVREDPALRFRQYDLHQSPAGLEMRSEGRTVGTISGVLFVDGAEI